MPALGCAIYYSARIAVADSFYRQDTPESLAQAVKADPGNAAYHQLYAEHLESLGRDTVQERETAALLSPLDSHYWIDLGAEAEVHGDYPAAERYYLKAASVDRKFAPRWALMNFYLRRHEEGPFWQWAEQAMKMAYGDSSEVFRLCWLMTDDKASIARKIPQSDYLRLEYLRFLMSDGHLDAAVPVAQDAAERATPSDVKLLLAFCDSAMTTNPGAAMRVWNVLSRRKLLISTNGPFVPLDPDAGTIVTNGAFATAPIGMGFDWHLPNSDGVSVGMSGGSGVSVELTGEQPQAVTVLNQWIPVEEGRSYRIDYRYSADADGPLAAQQASGLAWEIENPLTGSLLARGENLKSGVNGAAGHVDFSAGELSLAMLSLRYERTPGTVRREAKFTIQKVASRLRPVTETLAP